MTGGPNSLELLWAILALLGIVGVVVMSGVAWLALWVEAHLAGMVWRVPLFEMPGVLFDLTTGNRPDVLMRTVAAPWRPILIASVGGLLVAAAVLRGVRAWLDWQAGWRHRQRTRERITSRVWARRRHLTRLLVPAPRAGEGELRTRPAASRLLPGP